MVGIFPDLLSAGGLQLVGRHIATGLAKFAL
jgi:hypothetical protein